MNRDLFFLQYVAAALWSSTGDDDEPLDKKYGPGAIASETAEKMRADCDAFFDQYGSLFEGEEEHAGQDFWLTRNRHGAGFWDGDWEESVGQKLTNAAHAAGEVSLYVGDDGRVYGSEG